MVINLRRAAELYWAEAWLPLWRGIEALKITHLSEGRLCGLTLDIGCGDGRFGQLLQEIFDHSLDLVGLDLDSVRLHRAIQSNAYLALVRASAYKLPFEDGVFDNVICNSVLEHMSQPDDVLVECGRVLREGGRLFVTVPSENFESLKFRIPFLALFWESAKGQILCGRAEPTHSALPLLEC